MPIGPHGLRSQSEQDQKATVDYGLDEGATERFPLPQTYKLTRNEHQQVTETMKLQFSSNYDRYLMIYNSLRATAMALNRDQHSGTTSTADKGWLAGLDHFLEQLLKFLIA